MMLRYIKRMKHFFKYTIVWISQNLAIPFWSLGHLHLMLNVYDDLVEICASVGMNIIVFVGFIISYLDEKRAKN
jgi:hydrogenase maturation factor